MARIAIFSKYFGYNVGGAERSVLELLKQEEAKGHQITALVVNNINSYGSESLRLMLPETWEIREISLPIDMVRFRFIAYLINKFTLNNIAKTLSDIDKLYAYGHYAPAVINAFNGDTVYLVRDEYGLGWNFNYHKGIKKWLFNLYRLTEWPLEKLWLNELNRAIKKSHLIANSKFIAKELRKLAPQSDVEIIYSQIDASKLLEEFNRHQKSEIPKGLVLIGDNVLKGGDITRKIAKRLPNEIFYLFDRRYQTISYEENLVFMPWQSSGKVYVHAKLVLLPSRWHDAFPRVILESQQLNIPVIASNRGGIPEAIADQAKIINNLENVDEWVEKISLELYSSAH